MSRKIIISSGWVKKDGLDKLIPSFKKAIENNNSLITIFSIKNILNIFLYLKIKKLYTQKYIILNKKIHSQQ